MLEIESADLTAYIFFLPFLCTHIRILYIGPYTSYHSVQTDTRLLKSKKRLVLDKLNHSLQRGFKEFTGGGQLCHLGVTIVNISFSDAFKIVVKVNAHHVH